MSQKGDRSELPFIRKTLADDFVGYSAADIDYLTRHGEWQDIELIISMVDRHDYVTPSPWVSPDKKNRHAAVAIHRIGKNRIEELIAMPMPAEIGQKISQIKNHLLLVSAEQILIIDSKDNKVAEAIQR